jgi:Fic-DOC domain mobile mystery protein B
MIDPASHIDGQTPLDDLSGLKSKLIRTQADLNAAEAENIRRAMVRYFVGSLPRRARSFDIANLKRIHLEMFGLVWKWAGVFRVTQTNIGSAPHLIEQDLHNLLENAKTWKESGLSDSERIARFHHGAVLIHPFPNGNGRWARMITNIALRQEGHPIIMWPETTLGGVSAIRAQYLASLRSADRGEFSSLMELIESCRSDDA